MSNMVWNVSTLYIVSIHHLSDNEMIPQFTRKTRPDVIAFLYDHVRKRILQKFLKCYKCTVVVQLIFLM